MLAVEGLFVISYGSHLNVFQLAVYDLNDEGNLKYLLSNSSTLIQTCLHLSINHTIHLACGCSFGQSDTRVSLWNLSTGQLEFSIANSSFYMSVLKISEYSSYLITQSTIDFNINVWNVTHDQGVYLEFSLVGHTNIIISYQRVESILATKSLDNSTKIWNMTNRTLMFTFQSDNETCSNVWSPLGESLCSLGDFLLGEALTCVSTITIWNLLHGQLEFTLNPNKNASLSAFTYDLARLENASLMASLLAYYV